MQAAERLAFTSGDLLGVPPRPWDLAELVAARLRGGSPGAPVIEALASELRSTDFSRALDDLARLEASGVEARWTATRTEEAVSWFERLDVFTRGATETAADEAKEALTRVEREAHATMAVASDLFLRAVGRHPVLALHVGTGDVGAAVWALLPVAGVFGDATVGGVEHAWRTIHAWGAEAHAVLGRLEPAANVLERYAAAKLRAGRGFSA